MESNMSDSGVKVFLFVRVMVRHWGFGKSLKGVHDSPKDHSNSMNSTVAWKWPWIVFLLGLYGFAVPWIADAIFVRYYVEQNYNDVLAGLDTTMARKVTMVGHMSLGAVCLVLGPFQFLPVIRRRWPVVHRWMGRIYVCSALACSCLGIIFIFLKRFILVGGINMGLAFFVAGSLFGVSAFLTAYYARRQRWTQHRNWSIRAYSQILAPMMYRYFYLILGGLQMYPDLGEVKCNDRDVCFPFTRVFDSIHAWTYFLAPLAFAEGIIRCLPKVKDHEIAATTKDVSSTPHETQNLEDRIEAGEDKAETGETPNSDEHNYRPLNLLGLGGAVFSVVATSIIYITSIAGVNTVST